MEGTDFAGIVKTNEQAVKHGSLMGLFEFGELIAQQVNYPFDSVRLFNKEYYS